MCREEAFDINALFAESGPLSEDTCQLVGIVKETAPTKQCVDDNCLGVGDFMTMYFSRGQVYRDDSLLFYKALGNRSLLKNGFFGTLNPVSIWREGKKLGKRLEVRASARTKAKAKAHHIVERQVCARLFEHNVLTKQVGLVIDTD